MISKTSLLALYVLMCLSVLFRARTHTHMPNTIVDVALALDFRIVNINYNEVYKHCLFIVMYYDVQ